MHRSKLLLLSASLLSVIAFSCAESDVLPEVAVNEYELNEDQSARRYRWNPANSCDMIDYPDTLVYLNSDRKENMIKPIQSFKGTYGSFPIGLDINPFNGEINVNQSETGVKFKVYFVPANSSDTCFTHFTISGVDFLSEIYSLSKNQKEAKPLYNGMLNNYLRSTDKTGKGLENHFFKNEELTLLGLDKLPDGLVIDEKSGSILLEKSVENGLFGAKPENGKIVKVKLHYKLDDESGKSLNKIIFRLHYYNSLEDVPEELKEKVKNVQNYYGNFKSQGSPNGRLSSEFAKPRPPDVIVIG